MEERPDRDEFLLDRVIDGGASDSDWLELELRARQEPRVWDRLGRALRAETEVRSALEAEIAIADDIELPLPAPRIASTPRLGLSAISGWAAALLFAGLFFTSVLGDESGVSDRDVAGDDPSTEIGREATIAHLPLDDLGERAVPESWEQLFDDAFAAYVATGESGDRIQVLDPIVVDAQPSDGDEVEVWMIRRALERRRIDKAWAPAVDEYGREQLIPVPASHIAAGETL